MYVCIGRHLEICVRKKRPGKVLESLKPRTLATLEKQSESVKCQSRRIQTRFRLFALRQRVSCTRILDNITEKHGLFYVPRDSPITPL